MCHRKIYGVIGLIICGYFPATRAQTTLTVEQCVDIALERNLQRKQQHLLVENAAIDRTQTRLSYLPSVNGSVSANRQFGTTFDSFSFLRTREETDFVSPRLSASLPLFEGLSRYYTLQRQGHLLAAEQAAVEVVENTILQTVLGQYLQIIFDQAQLSQSEQRLQLLEQQLERTQKRVAAGVGVEADVLNLKGQVAAEKLTLVTRRNQLQSDRLSLLQQLQLDVLADYTFVVPDTAAVPVGTPDSLPTLPQLLEDAYRTMPQLREQQARLDAAKAFAKATRGNLSPSLSFMGSLGSNYSSNVSRFLPDRSSLGDQLSDNFFQTIGFQLNVPIFNGWQVQRNWQLAKNQIRFTDLSYKIQQDQLTRDVQRALLDTRAAQARYQAVQEQLAALREAFAYADKRFNAGVLDFYSWQESLNNLNRAELDLLQARFEFYFRYKLLEVFQGKALRF
ncbi:MAG: TolC family protein [Bacteroidetes bacterium]|nr:TolC family protein [Bacteroidota bacterium]